MKKIFLAFIGMSFLLSSCSDFLDVSPTSQWSADKVPTELAHLHGILNGGYKRIGSTLVTGFTIYGDARADVYYPNNAGAANYDRLIHSQIDSEMSWSNWSNFYSIIRQANLNIYYIPQMIENGKIKDDSEVQSILGQAYAQRAFAYFWIVRIWGGCPLILEPVLNSKDVPVLPRSSVDSVMMQIQSDLDQALTYIPAQTSAANVTRTKFSPVACHALKAQAYMWEHKYSEALAELNLAIPTSTSLYTLASLYSADVTPPASFANDVSSSAVRAFIPSTEFVKMFNSNTGGTTKESIFEFAQSAGDNDINNTFNSYWLNSSGTYFKVREDFRNAFTPNDFRYYASIEQMSGGKCDALKWIHGYEKGDARNVVLIRLGELLLLRAEARIMLAADDVADADRKEIMTDINKIMVRAYGVGVDAGNDTIPGYMNHSEYDKAAFLELLKSERRKELAFEGHRWFDLARWGDTYETMRSLVPAESANYPFETGAIELDPLGRDVVWPIYLEEIRRTNGIIEQNEYYK